jgi:hypothetical protein
MNRRIPSAASLAVAVGPVLSATAAVTATAAVPKPLPADLKRPFVGVSIPAAWFGRWHEAEPPSIGDGFDWHLLPARTFGH